MGLFPSARARLFRSFLVVLILTGLLVSGLSPAPSPEAAAQTNTSADEAPTDDLPSTREELTELRTRNAKFYQEPDGTRTAEIYAEPVHFETDSGRWLEIDTSLVASDRAGYAYENRRGAIAVEFSATAKESDMVRVQSDGAVLTFGVAGANPASRAVVSADRLTYPGIFPGVDLVFEVTPEGLKEFVALTKRPDKPLSVRFPFSVQGVRPKELAGGDISFVGGDGKSAFALPQGWMFDSSGSEETEPAVSDAVNFDLDLKSPKPAVTLTADSKWLADPARVYPVMVDPTLETLHPSPECHITNGANADSTHCSHAVLRVGWDTSMKRRGLLKFPVEQLPDDAIITDAEFRLYLTDSTTTRVAPIEVHRLTSSWGAGVTWKRRTWNNQNLWGTQGGDFTNFVWASRQISGTEPGYKAWEATSLVREWHKPDGAPNHGVVFKQDTESVNNLVSFASTQQNLENRRPKLDIRYNFAPDEVSGLAPDANAYLSTITPTLHGVFSDSGNVGRVDYEVVNDSTGTQVTSGSGPNVASGADSPWTVPAGALSDGVTYRWRARAFDDWHYSPTYSAWRTFTIDTTAPTAPTVSSVDFPQGQPSEVTTGTFDFSSSPDVVEYLYSLDGGPEESSTTGSVELSPGPGLHSLVVRARDRAANTSPQTSYEFEAGGGPFPDPGPTGVLTAPRNNSTISGEVALTAAPTPGDTVNQVDFYSGSLGTRKLIASDSNGADGWSVSLDTRELPEGRVDLSVEFRDDSGNIGCCVAGSGVAVTVDNADPAPEPWTSTVEVPALAPTVASNGEVSLNDGALLAKVFETEIPGPGPAATFDRSYSSQSDARGILGPGWRTNVEDALVPAANGSVLYVNGAGREQRFAPQTAAALTAEYWNNTDLSGTSVLARNDAHVDFDWGTASPGADVNEDNFSARWTGFVDTASPGDWTFYASTDDGVKLWVDGHYVINEWDTKTSETESTGTIHLEPGRHELRMEYFEASGAASATLSYQGPGVPKEVVPATQLSHGTGAFDSPAGVYEDLTKAADGSFTLRHDHRVAAHYTPSGRLDKVTDANGNNLSFAYGSNGRPKYLCLSVATCDATAAKVTLTFDASDRLGSVADAASRTWSYTYDEAGRLASVTGPKNAVTTYNYDPANRLIRVTDAEGGVTEITYASGRVASIKDAVAVANAGPARTFAYDTPAVGKVTVTDPDANKTSPPGPGEVYEVGPSGEQVSYTDELGHKTTYTYDGNFNLLTDVGPTGNKYSYTYNDDGLKLSETDPQGAKVTNTYENGNLTSVTDAIGETTTFTHDSAGNVLTETDARNNTTTFTYYADGNLESETDALGNKTTYTYDAVGNMSSETEPSDASPAGSTTTYTYNAAGNARTETDPLNKTTTYSYDDYGNVLSVTDPADQKATFTYDKLGRPETSVDPVGNEPGKDPDQYTTTITYNPAGQLKSQTDALGNTSTVTYDWNGNPVSTTDPRGNAASVVYDPLDRPIKEVEPDGTETISEYDGAGNLEAVTDPKGTTMLTHDDAGKLLSETDPQGNKTTYTYNAAGEIATATAPAGNLPDAAQGSYTWKYAYNAIGDVRTVTDPLGHMTTYSYNTVDELSSITDAAGTRTTFEYDSAGRKDRSEIIGSKSGGSAGTVDEATPEAETGFSVSAPGIVYASLTWDSSSDLDLYLLDSTGVVVAQAPDHAAKPEILTYLADAGNYTLKVVARNGSAQWHLDYGVPSVQVATTDHDVAGRVASVTDARGTTTFGYDNANQLRTVTLPNQSTETYAYDAAGAEIGITDSTGTQSFTYDRAGRMATATNQAGVTTSYGYDSAANEASVTRSGTSFSFEHDTRNRLSQRTENAAVTRIGYGDGVFPTKITHASGEQDERTFDANGNVTSLALRPQAAALPTRQLSYGYSGQGNLETVKDITNPEAPTTLSSYGYDENDRLTSETNLVSGEQRTQTYAYDQVGNRTKVTSSQEAVTTFTYNPAGQLVARTEPSGAMTAYFYDGVGNVIRSVSPSGTTEYLWSAQGDLVTIIKPDGTEISFLYDATGQRVKKSLGTMMTTYSYENGRLVSLTKDGATTKFTYDDAGTPLTLTTNGATYVYRTDHRGSMIELTDAATHHAVVTYRYDAWGNILESTGPQALLGANPFTFLGSMGVMRDLESGLYLMKARYYDPTLARFISRDPAEDNPSITSYAYAENNPLVKADPTGLFSILVPGVAFNPEDYNSRPRFSSFRNGVQSNLARLGLGPEGFLSYKWNRYPWQVKAAVFDRRKTQPFRDFRGYAWRKCDLLHRQRPPTTCNLIGHSAGAMFAAYAARSVPKSDFLMTMAGPHVGGIFKGTWFREGPPSAGRPRWWVNLREKLPPIFGKSQNAEWANVNKLTRLDHAEFWNSKQAPRWAAKGICRARLARVYWRSACRA